MPPLNDPKAEEYALHIQEIVSQLKKTSKKALAENEAYSRYKRSNYQSS